MGSNPFGAIDQNDGVGGDSVAENSFEVNSAVEKDSAADVRVSTLSGIRLSITSKCAMTNTRYPNGRDRFRYFRLRHSTRSRTTGNAVLMLPAASVT